MLARAERIVTESLPVEVVLLAHAGDSTRARAARVVDLHEHGIGLSHDGLNADERDVVGVLFPLFLRNALLVCGTVRWWDERRLGVEVDKMGRAAMARYRTLVREIVVDGYAQR